MRRKLALLLMATGLGVTGSCVDIFGPTNLPLDMAHATITVTLNTNGTQAAVVIKLVDAQGHPIVLKDGQAVLINDQPVTGPNQDDEYTLTAAAADTYVVTVVEPTRGNPKTTLTVPAAFQISAPVANSNLSLAQDFQATWSNPDANLRAAVELRQATGLSAPVVKNLAAQADTGARTVTAANLGDFLHGTAGGRVLTLDITVTKTNEQAGSSVVQGFNSTVLRTQRSQTVTVIPGP